MYYHAEISLCMPTFASCITAKRQAAQSQRVFYNLNSFSTMLFLVVTSTWGGGIRVRRGRGYDSFPRGFLSCFHWVTFNRASGVWLKLLAWWRVWGVWLAFYQTEGAPHPRKRLTTAQKKLVLNLLVLVIEILALLFLINIVFTNKHIINSCMLVWNMDPCCLTFWSNIYCTSKAF